jgi:predicted glutamine amidotransferase
MCRLFGMTGGREPVQATFWLLEAPDSLARQSHREPDGAGIGAFSPAGDPIVSKQPLAAYHDPRFGREARSISSRTFVAHVRFASNGGLTAQNTHPFEMHGRLFAHNGVIGDLAALEAELGAEMELVHGESDSERFFALITREIDRCGGDVAAGIEAAARWVADHLPVFAINCVLITPEDLWALRFPLVHELHVLERAAGGSDGSHRLEHASTHRADRAGARGAIKVSSGALAERPAVIVATEPMDDDPGWAELGSGELLHVDRELRLTRRQVLDGLPTHPLSLADLDPRAAESQSAAHP